MEDNFYPLAFISGIIVGAVVEKTNRFLSVTTSNNTGPNVSLFITLVYNGDVQADKNGTGLLHCPGRFPVQQQTKQQREVYREPILTLSVSLFYSQSTFTS